LNLYNIMPVFTATLMATPSSDVSITLNTAADDGGYGNVKEYRYSYALAGQSKTTWVSFTSWVNSSSVTFTPSLSGNYMFKADVRSKGRLTTDATAEATYEDRGYYLESLEDMMTEALPEPEASPTPTPSATPSASTVPSASAAPSAVLEPEMSSFDFAVLAALGEGTDVSGYTESDVAIDGLLGVLEAENAPTVIVQLGEDTYAVITGYTVDEAGNLTSLTLTDPTGEVILGGTEGIIKAWYYVPAEAAPSATPAPSISAVPPPSASVAPTDALTEPSETPAA
jgi:hypothetical protein